MATPTENETDNWSQKNDQNDSGWIAKQPTNSDLDTTSASNSWEEPYSSSKNNDRRHKKGGSYKNRATKFSATQEPSGWGAEPRNKDSGGWGGSSSNFEEVENWGITKTNDNDNNVSSWNSSSINHNRDINWATETDVQNKSNGYKDDDINNKGTEAWVVNSSDAKIGGWGEEADDNIKPESVGGWGEEADNNNKKQPENVGGAVENKDKQPENVGDAAVNDDKQPENVTGWGDEPENVKVDEWGDNTANGTGWGDEPENVKVDEWGDNTVNVTGWGDEPDNNNSGEGWGTITENKVDQWDPSGYEETDKTADWVNDQQSYSNNYSRRDDHRPRGSRGGRSFRGNRRGGRGGRSGRGGFSSGRGRRDGPPMHRDDDYRGHKPSSSREVQTSENHDLLLENEKNKDKPKYVNTKPGNIYESIHAPKTQSVPYVNKDRVLSGGVHQKPDEDVLTKKLEEMKIKNEILEKRRKVAEEDEASFRKTEEERKKQELENLELQKKIQEEEEQERKRHEFQQLQLQQEIDQEREENAMRKNKNRENREWDMEKNDSDWHDSRNQNNNSRDRGNTSYRNGSRDENSYRRVSRDENEYDESRNARGGRARSRGGGGGGRSRRRGRGGWRGKRYSDQYKDFPNRSATTEEGFGSGNSWAEQTEKDNNISWETTETPNEIENESNDNIGWGDNPDDKINWAEDVDKSEAIKEVPNKDEKVDDGWGPVGDKVVDDWN